LSGAVARLLFWYMRSVPEDKRIEAIDIVTIERQVDPSRSKVRDVVRGKSSIRIQKQLETPRLHSLVGALEVKELTGIEVDALVGLIYAAYEHVNQVGTQAAESIGYLLQSEALLRIFFDPLTIQSISKGQLPSNDCLELEVDRLTKVRWTDGREDMGEEEVIGPRTRPDHLVVRAVQTVETVEMTQQIFSALYGIYTRRSQFGRSQLKRILDSMMTADKSGVSRDWLQLPRIRPN